MIQPWMRPMLCPQGKTVPPEHLGQYNPAYWAAEAKLNGWRTIAYRQNGQVQLFNGRNGSEYCHEPGARILTADLRWVSAGDIKVGDELWAFDADSGYANDNGGLGRGSRRYRKAVVLASHLARKECVRVCLASGETFVCSVDHPWLSYSGSKTTNRWVRADGLIPRVAAGRRHLVRPVVPWNTDSSWEAGWLAGMFDGEGSVRLRTRSGATYAQGVTVSQVMGPTADRIADLAGRYAAFGGRIVRGEGRKPLLELSSNGGVWSAAEVIGRVRASRLIANFDLAGCELQRGRETEVVAVERVGERDIQSIQTTTGTYLAEGFAVHNTGHLPYLTEHLLEILPSGTCVDGELMSPLGRGHVQSTMFTDHPHHPMPGNPPLMLVIFDILRLNSQPIVAWPWTQRRRLVEAIQVERPYTVASVVLRVVSMKEGLRLALDAGAEGLMLKDRDSRYINGRSASWLKCKPQQTCEARITGFKEGKVGGEWASKCGAFLIELLDNGATTTIKCGTNSRHEEATLEFLGLPFTHQPWLGATIEIKHHGLSDTGVPQHPQFGIRRRDLEAA